MRFSRTSSWRTFAHRFLPVWALVAMVAVPGLLSAHSAVAHAHGAAISAPSFPVTSAPDQSIPGHSCDLCDYVSTLTLAGELPAAVPAFTATQIATVAAVAPQQLSTFDGRSLAWPRAPPLG